MRNNSQQKTAETRTTMMTKTVAFSLLVTASILLFSAFGVVAEQGTLPATSIGLKSRVFSALRMRRKMLQAATVSDKPVCDLSKCPHKCKRQSTARMLSLVGGAYGAGRIYLGYLEVGALKLLVSFFGVCVPLCHLYVFGFSPENNDNKANRRKKRISLLQKLCRCNCKRVKIPFTKRLLPCWGTTGNPFYGLFFAGFVFLYAYDVINIASGNLVALAPFKDCYLKDI